MGSIRPNRSIRYAGRTDRTFRKENINVFNCFEDDIGSVDFSSYGKIRLAYFPRSESMIEQKVSKYGVGEN